MNLSKIPQAEQEGILGSFWTMLQECERKADDSNDPALKLWVSQWYGQWNRITGDTKGPRWLVPNVELRGGPAELDRRSVKCAALLIYASQLRDALQKEFPPLAEGEHYAMVQGEWCLFRNGECVESYRDDPRTPQHVTDALKEPT